MLLEGTAQFLSDVHILSESVITQVDSHKLFTELDNDHSNELPVYALKYQFYLLFNHNLIAFLMNSLCHVMREMALLIN